VAGIYEGRFKPCQADRERITKLSRSISKITPALFPVWIAREKFRLLSDIVTQAEKNDLLASSDLAVYSKRLEDLIKVHEAGVMKKLAGRYRTEKRGER